MRKFLQLISSVVLMAAISDATAAPDAPVCAAEQPGQRELMSQEEFCRKVVLSTREKVGPLFETELDRSQPSAFWDTSVSVLRCLQGMGDAIIDIPKDIAALAKMIFVDLPKSNFNPYGKEKLSDGRIKPKTGSQILMENFWHWWDDDGGYDDYYHSPVDGEYKESADAALEAAMAAAADPRGAIEKLCDEAKALYAGLEKIYEIAKKMVAEEVAEYNCLPPSLRTGLLCKITANVLMIFLTPEGLVKGAPMLAKLVQASKLNALAITKVIKNAVALAGKEGSISDRLARLAVTLEKMQKQSSVLQSVTRGLDILWEVDETGNSVFKLRRMVNGQEQLINLTTHSLTGTIMTKAGDGEKAAATIIEALEKGKSAFIQFDLNDLGVVNYFQDGLLANGKKVVGGFPAGDEYISAFAKDLQSVLRDTDVIFNNGGDEFVVLLPLSNSENAADDVASIISKVKSKLKSPESATSSIFQAQESLLGEYKQAADVAKKIDDLPKAAKDLLEKILSIGGEGVPKKALADLTPQEAAILFERIKPSSRGLAPGAEASGKIIQEGDNFQSLSEATSKEIGAAKATKPGAGKGAKVFGIPTEK